MLSSLASWNFLLLWNFMLLLLLITLSQKAWPRRLFKVAGPGFLLGAACLYSPVLQAEHLGLPELRAFPSAQYPHARRISHCTRWRLPDGVAEQDLDVSFRGACQAHDQCFHTLGSSWSACNHEYREHLRQACRRDLKTARLAAGQLGDPTPVNIRRCYDLAESFVARVQAKEAIARYDFAQRQQEAYLTLLSQWIRDQLKLAEGQDKAIDLSVAQIFNLLNQGVSFEELVPSRARLEAPENTDESMGTGETEIIETSAS